MQPIIFHSEYRDTVFIGNPVTGRVNHDRLEQHGSTYKAIEQPDFLSCDDGWFRPVDIKLGPDGALYIADFYNCIIGHYEVPLTHPRRDRSLGRIWRVVYTGTEQSPGKPLRPMPDLTRLRHAWLVDLLDDPNLTVRIMASEQLAAQLSVPEIVDCCPLRVLVATVSDERTATRKAHALWLVERARTGGLTGDFVELLAADPSRLVRIHLIKRAGGTPGLERLVGGSLQTGAGQAPRLADPFVRRAAADAARQAPACGKRRTAPNFVGRNAARRYSPESHDADGAARSTFATGYVSTGRRPVVDPPGLRGARGRREPGRPQCRIGSVFAGVL